MSRAPDPAGLTRLVLDYVSCEGASAAGVATVATLAGGPPSADISYVLPEARAAVSFALPLDQGPIVDFLAKRDRLAHERDNLLTNALASGIALQLAKFLEQKGFASEAVAANDVYRPEGPQGRLGMYPDVSLRYLAAAAGVGRFGWSGNVLVPGVGAGVILGAVVTAAPLEATPALADEAGYCDRCGLCLACCASGMMDPDHEERVRLGGREFVYSRRRNYYRCQFVCGGATGLHPSGRWSTWSPGRLDIPERDEDFFEALREGFRLYNRRPEMAGGHYHSLMRQKLWLTCGNCQLVCVPDLAERRRRHRLVVESGVIVQHPDGSLESLPPEAAADYLDSVEPEFRSLYAK